MTGLGPLAFGTPRQTLKCVCDFIRLCMLIYIRIRALQYYVKKGVHKKPRLRLPQNHEILGKSGPIVFLGADFRSISSSNYSLCM